MEAGRLTDLLFVHGGPGFDEYLRQSFEVATTAAGFTSYFYQQHKRVSVESLVQQLADEIQKISSPQIVVVAHSWGVPLVLETIKQKFQRNHKIGGLVLIDGFVSCEMNQAFADRLKELGLADQYSMEDIFLSKNDRAAAWPSEYLLKLMATLDQETLDRIYDEYLGTLDLRDFAKTLMLPILVVFGSEDVRVPPNYQRKYAADLANAEMLEIAGAGHFPFLQADDLRLVVNAIKRFCETNVSRAKNKALR